jgi:hypothetical protein
MCCAKWCGRRMAPPPQGGRRHMKSTFPDSDKARLCSWRSVRALRVGGAAIGAVIAVALCATGCANSSSDRVAVRVGQATISEQAVRHWTRALSDGGLVRTFVKRSGQTRKQLALDFLISAQWLLGEALDRGLAVSAHGVRQRLEELSEAVPGGHSAFAESLAGSGRTVGDVELEIKAELAASAIRRSLARVPGSVPPAAAVSYYKAFEGSFRIPEQREFDIVENLKSEAIARQFAQHAGTGARFAKRAFHEKFSRPVRFDSRTLKGRALHAIFVARPGMLSSPMRLNDAWILFVVTRVVRPAMKPFSAVRARIAARLANTAHAEAIRQFDASYVQRWRSITSCRPGFVVLRCSQYSGAGVDEDPLEL